MMYRIFWVVSGVRSRVLSVVRSCELAGQVAALTLRVASG